MSKIDLQSKLVIGAAVGAGIIATTGLALWYHHMRNHAIPRKWRHVGEISELVCYPIQLCGPIKVNTLTCTNQGVKDHLLRDRTFMVLTSRNGKFTTVRQYPKLVHIFPRFEDEDMILSAAGMPDIKVNVTKLFPGSTIKYAIWGKSDDSIDCGDEVANWISRFLVNEDFGMRLVFYPNVHPAGEVEVKGLSFLTRSSRSFLKLTTKAETQTKPLPEEATYMLINESSIDELNTRLEKAVTPLRFRANFVVHGAQSWDEDNWKWIKIGHTVVFRYIKPCARCTFTNVDPETARRDPDGETLKALRSYRQFKGTGTSPFCGIHMGMRVPGDISLGDSVYVSYK